MRVFVAGATGVLGRRLVPLLTSTGHQVIGSTTSAGKLARLRMAGADGVVVDILDAASTARAIDAAKPDVVVHEATALGELAFDPRRFDAIFARTNALRTVGTRNLLAAATSAGVDRFVAASFCGWPFAPVGGIAKAEDDSFDPNPPKSFVHTLAALQDLESMVTAAGGVVLRYGGFYGPGTSLDVSGEQTIAIRKRRLPIVGAGTGIFSFIHVDDAATATLAALTRGSGIYNIVDDDPAAVRDWIPYLAEVLGAKPPRKVAPWLARLIAGEAAVRLMTQARGGSNAKARRDLDWKPRYPSWREGFAHELG
jgi:nucleoside-diphosphate-sugar epimerase